MSLIAAIDQGTTSTRCIVFEDQRPVSSAQLEHRQIFPQPGWVEHDAWEIWENTQKVAVEAARRAGCGGSEIDAVGITNQRETTVAWDVRTGRPVCNAIVWQDTRTQEICDTLEEKKGRERFREVTGLPPATYFSGPKMRWMMQHVPGLSQAVLAGHVVFGTMDSWLIWNLTGGVHGGRRVTDVTNASRTLLMNLHTTQWDQGMLEAFGIPQGALSRIVSCSHAEAFGVCDAGGPFGAEVPIGGCLGDQQAALVGQACFGTGEIKNTYGTGCFMLMNTGAEIPTSRAGLLSTVAYRFGDEPTVYALEGSVAAAGSLVQWLRDNMGLIHSAAEIESLARQAADNGGVYIVPAFAGLFAPWWRPDARGIIAGLTQFSNRAHIARAALESAAFQTRDVLEAMISDTGIRPTLLKVDGGMAANDLLMQFQADLLNIPVHRSAVSEATALGAAIAAALATDSNCSREVVARQWSAGHTWNPHMDAARRHALCDKWHKAVKRSMDWA